MNAKQARVYMWNSFWNVFVSLSNYSSRQSLNKRVCTTCISLKPEKLSLRKSYATFPWFNAKSRKYQGVWGEKSRKDKVRGIWSQQLEHKQVPQWGTEPGVRKGKRSLLACHARCKFSMETTHNRWRSSSRYQGHEIGGKSDWVGSHCWSRIRMSFNIRERDTSYCWIKWKMPIWQYVFCLAYYSPIHIFLKYCTLTGKWGFMTGLVETSSEATGFWS